MEALNLWQSFSPDSRKVIVQKQENFDYRLLLSETELQTPTLNYIPIVKTTNKIEKKRNDVRYYTNKNKIKQTSITQTVKESKIEEKSKPKRKWIDNKNTSYKDLNNLPNTSVDGLYGIKPIYKGFVSPYIPIKLNKPNKKYQIDTKIDNIQFTSSNKTLNSKENSNDYSPNINQSNEISLQNLLKNKDQLQNFSQLESLFKERPKTKNQSEFNDYSQTQFQMNEIFDQNSIQNTKILACENLVEKILNKTDSNEILIQKGFNDKDICYENEVEINTENEQNLELDNCNVNMVENFCQILNKKETDIFSELPLNSYIDISLEEPNTTEQILDYYENILDDITTKKTDTHTKKTNLQHNKVSVNVNLKNLPTKSLLKIRKILNKTKVINVTKIKIKKPNLSKTKIKKISEKVDRETFTDFEEKNMKHYEKLVETYKKLIDQQSLLISQYENMIRKQNENMIKKDENEIKNNNGNMIKNDENVVKNNDENIIKKDENENKNMIIKKENKIKNNDENIIKYDEQFIKEILAEIQNNKCQKTKNSTNKTKEKCKDEDKKATYFLRPKAISSRSHRISKTRERPVLPHK